jgi:hypothetical protein
VGQCWPHPAPEPVMRTMAPINTTSTVATVTLRAVLANVDGGAPRDGSSLASRSAEPYAVSAEEGMRGRFCHVEAALTTGVASYS